MSTEQDNGLVKNLLNLGEERMSEVVGQLLANERFVNAMQSAVTQGLTAKRTMDKSVSRIFHFANVPTLEDVEQVREKMQELEDMLGDVLDRVQALDERLERARSASGDESTESTESGAKKKKSGAKKKAASKKKASKS